MDLGYYFEKIDIMHLFQTQDSPLTYSIISKNPTLEINLHNILLNNFVILHHHF